MRSNKQRNAQCASDEYVRTRGTDGSSQKTRCSQALSTAVILVTTQTNGIPVIGAPIDPNEFHPTYLFTPCLKILPRRQLCSYGHMVTIIVAGIWCGGTVSGVHQGRGRRGPNKTSTRCSTQRTGFSWQSPHRARFWQVFHRIPGIPRVQAHRVQGARERPKCGARSRYPTCAFRRRRTPRMRRICSMLSLLAYPFCGVDPALLR